MIAFSVKGKEYKLKFGYKVLVSENLFKEFSKISNQENGVELEDIISMLPKMLLAGLQKYHKKEFGYTSDKEKEERMELVYDLLDDYEDESTVDNPHNGYDLFNEIEKELMKNGFLSGMLGTSQKDKLQTEDQPKLIKE